MHFKGEIKSFFGRIEYNRGGTAGFLPYNIQKVVWLVLEWKLVLYTNATKLMYEHQAHKYSKVIFLNLEGMIPFTRSTMS